MSLMDLVRAQNMSEITPLAQRMKPTSLDDFIGQEHILGPGKLLRRSIEADRMQSIILYGPPGTGKTSIASLISKLTAGNFKTLNAVTSGVKDIKEVVEGAKRALELDMGKTILFIDEIHRFNKSQQDALLPHVEKGIVTLIGATTENPYFEVNKALLSRSMVFELHKLQQEDLIKIVKRAMSKDQILKDQSIDLDEEALNFLTDRAAGDARRALNALELAVLTTSPKEERIHITKEVISECIQQKYIDYDKKGDNHYDVISAFIKSVRGSDPDAALHYLAKMISAGEDLKFIARRLIILASEDIGLANSNALRVAIDAMQGIHFVGMPEGRIILGHATLYLALSPKSNSAYLGIDAALADLKEKHTSVPNHLRDGTSKSMRGDQAPYLYPHENTSGYVLQQYLPDELMGSVYYEGKHLGDEKRLLDYRKKLLDFAHKKG